MKISLALIDLSVIEEVSLPLWRELLDAIGWPESLRGRSDSFTHGDILSAFQQDTPSDALLQALEALDNLGTPAGREAISKLLADRQVSPSVLPHGLGERDLALRLFLAQRGDSALAEVFLRAQIELQEENHRRFNDFTGKQPKSIRDLPKKSKELENVMREYCLQEDLGDHVQVHRFDDDEGAYCFQIIHSYHTRTPLAVTKGSNARAKIQYRPVHADLLRYEPALGRLRITARAASMVECYRKVFGRVMFGDETFFYGPDVCSLNILQEKGRAALEKHGVYGAGRIWMTECVWERGDTGKMSFNALDCFDSIERHNIPLNEGQLLQAKLKIEVVGKSARPVTVKIRVPSRIEVSQVQHEGLVNTVLEAIGIRNVHTKVSEHDLWTLYPWRQPIGAWRGCFGANTDALVAKGVLTKIRLTSIVPPVYPGAGHILQVEPVSPTEFLGVSQTPEIPSQSLSATDVDGFELSVPVFQRHLRSIFGITGNFNPWSTDSWCLDLGVLSIGEAQLRIFYAIRQPSHDAVEDVRKLTGSIRPVLLLPSGLKDTTGLTEVLLDTAHPDRQRAVQDIIAASNLTAHAPALCTAPANARLIVDTRFGKIWFDAVEIQGLVPGTHAFSFVEIMARKFPTAVNMHDLAEQLSPGRNDGDHAARAAKARVKKLIGDTLRAKGMDFEDPFKVERGAYRLTVLAHHSDTATSPLSAASA